MDRREFVRLASTGLSAGALAEAVVSAQIAASPAPSSTPPRKALMKIGTQQGDAEDMLRAFAAFGVNNICGSLPSTKLDEAWSVDALSKRRERVEAHGISLDMLPLPMSSHEIGTAELPAIYLGASAERDRDIDTICAPARRPGAAARATASSSTRARSRIRP
jgi:mannonate dehydratase